MEYDSYDVRICWVSSRVSPTQGSTQQLSESLVPVHQVDGAPLISFQKNELLELVGKTLEAMRKEAFNPKSRQGTRAEKDPVTLFSTFFEEC